MIGPDRYIRIRPYLDVILRPLPVWVTTDSCHVLGRLQLKYGKDTLSGELDLYFKQMGSDGQRDPFNPY